MEQLSRIEARLESLSELGDLVARCGPWRPPACARRRRRLAGRAPFAPCRPRDRRRSLPLAEWPEAAEKAEPAGVLLVITSQNGFVGGFNERLAEATIAARRPEERVIVVGRRGEIALAERGVTAEEATR
jgi:F-type H+-transporting ATPase subunit gamma